MPGDINSLGGFSDKEILCYKHLLANHPLNGYQLSLESGIPRSRIYDILRSLKRKGLAAEIQEGQYVPLPAEEFLRRVEDKINNKFRQLKDDLLAPVEKIAYEYVWTLEGYDKVIEKARQMISSAEKEIYLRLYPEESGRVAEELGAALSRGVEIKSIAMGQPVIDLDLQLIHPRSKELIDIMGGRSVDVVVDRAEVLVGFLHPGQEDASPINWAKNHWFVYATRESLRHDFYHCILTRVFESNSLPGPEEKRIYRLIANDL